MDTGTSDFIESLKQAKRLSKEIDRLRELDALAGYINKLVSKKRGNTGHKLKEK